MFRLSPFSTSASAHRNGIGSPCTSVTFMRLREVNARNGRHSRGDGVGVEAFAAERVTGLNSVLVQRLNVALKLCSSHLAIESERNEPLLNAQTGRETLQIRGVLRQSRWKNLYRICFAWFLDSFRRVRKLKSAYRSFSNSCCELLRWCVLLNAST